MDIPDNNFMPGPPLTPPLSQKDSTPNIIDFPILAPISDE